MKEVKIDKLWVPYDVMSTKRTKQLDKKMVFLGTSGTIQVNSRLTDLKTLHAFYNDKAEPDDS